MLRAASRVCRQLSRYGGATNVMNRCAAPLSTAASTKFTGKLACLDLEGVLIPEVWVNLADQVGVEALKRTTRDEPDYDVLMKYRLDIMKKEGLGIHDINAAIESMDPLPGAVDMVAWLRERFQVIILSDTFYEFGMPFMKKLGHPTLFCHKLSIDANGTITNYHMRQPDPKRKSINAFRLLNYTTIATGDSYNDTTMLAAADAGILFDANQEVIDKFPQFPVAFGYDRLKEEFTAADERTNK
jgi:phosphoserine/homoserine phosphotransferase